MCIQSYAELGWFLEVTSANRPTCPFHQSKPFLLFQRRPHGKWYFDFNNSLNYHFVIPGYANWWVIFQSTHNKICDVASVKKRCSLWISYWTTRVYRDTVERGVQLIPVYGTPLQKNIEAEGYFITAVQNFPQMIQHLRSDNSKYQWLSTFLFQRYYCKISSGADISDDGVCFASWNQAHVSYTIVRVSPIQIENC